MMRLRRALGALALGVLAASTGACAGTGGSDVAEKLPLGSKVASESTGSTTGATGTEPPTPTAPGLLYVAEADAASVAAVGDDGARLVTLTGTDASVLWFQDRPGRAAGDLSISEFVATWDELGFVDDPPNAVIRHSGGEEPLAGDGLGLVVEMADPVWDQPSATLRCTAVPAEGAGAIPALMNDVSLFIDDGGAGTTYHPTKVTATNVAPGQKVQIQVSPTGGRSVVWSMGDTAQDGAGFSLASGPGQAAVSDVHLDGQTVSIQTSAGAASGAITLSLDLFVATDASSGAVQFRSEADPGVEVSLSLGDSPPQTVNPTPTLFSLSG